MKNPGFGKTVCIVAIFCMASTIASHAQNFSTIFTFATDQGSAPVAGLIQGIDGNLYGSTTLGGASDPGDAGTIFKITPGGKMTTLYNFCSLANCADGADPEGALFQSIDGNFYGTTYGGGTSSHCPAETGGCGTIFELTPTGKLTTLYNFCSLPKCTDGAYPRASLLQYVNGNFYGTTSGGGTGDPYECSSVIACGTVFEFTPGGKPKILHSFCSLENCTDGSSPTSLILGTDGNFYGTGGLGGQNLDGTFFKISPSGNFTALHQFENSDGVVPNTILQANDGNFYGTTRTGGAFPHEGTIFKITPNGTLTVLFGFCISFENCADGAEPDAGLVQGTDGDLYGTTAQGGASETCLNGCGSVFKVTTKGKLTTLHSFCLEGLCPDGQGPVAPLLQDTSGAFYGTTLGGDPNCSDPTGCSTVFRLGVGLRPFVAANPGFGEVNEEINILGKNLMGATSVTFNGVATTFKVISKTLIRATVPTDAATGTIEVTTPGETLSSNVAFQVLP